MTPKENAKYIDFYVVNGELIYLPMNLLCVKESQKEVIIGQVYNNFNIGLGSGVKSLFNKIRNGYLGINREDVEKYLSKQSSYQ